MIRHLMLMLLFATSAHAIEMDMSMLTGANKVRYVNVDSSLAWSAPSYDFGSKNTGTNTDYTFTLASVEAEEISLSVTGAGYSLFNTNCGNNSFDLLTDTCAVTVRFSPASAGTLTGSLIAAWTNQPSVTASLTGVGVSADPYTTDFVSNWSGAGVQDTSNPSGGVYSGWTSVSDVGSRLANVGDALVATYVASNTASYVQKTGLVAKNDVSIRFRLNLSTLTMTTGSSAIQFVNVRTGSAGFVVALMTTSGSVTSIRVAYTNGSSSVVNTNHAFTFSPATNYDIELNCKFSTNTSTADGSYTLNINGVTVGTATGFATLISSATRNDFGMLYADQAVTGIITLDNFTRGYK